MKNVQKNSEAAYKALNAWISGEGGSVTQLMDILYPNHDGKQDAEMCGDLLLLRDQLYSLSKACEIAIEHINIATEE